MNGSKLIIAFLFDFHNYSGVASDYTAEEPLKLFEIKSIIQDFMP